MTKQISKLIVILLSLSLALSCEREVPLAPAKPVTIETFPDILGSQWEYYRVDNLQIIDPNKPELKFDTVFASISERLTDQDTGEEATIWRYNVTNKPSIIRPVFFSGDTVFIYWNWVNKSSIGLVFPFDDKDSWKTGILSGDETTVKEVISFRVPAGLFENVFVLENKTYSIGSTDYKRTITLWYVPNLGPIKIHLHEEHLQAVGDTTWTLVDHNFPGFD